MQKSMLKKTAAMLVSLFMIWTPTAVLAETTQEYASQGQVFGKSSLPNPVDLFGQGDSGNFVIYPGADGEIILTSDDLVPGASQQNLENYTSLFGDESGITDQTGTAQETLETEQSWTGEAYRTVFDSVNRDHPDLRNDPIWGATDQTLADVFSGEFSDCDLVTRITEDSFTTHVSDIRTCEVVEGSSNCVVKRVVNQIEFTPQSLCRPGAVLGIFPGRKSSFTYKCGNDGKSIVINDGVRIGNGFGNDYRLRYGGESGWTQTCVDVQDNARVCTVSGGSYNRYHPGFGGYQYDWDYLHSQSSHTYTIYNFRPEQCQTDEQIYSTPSGCLVSDSFCQTDNASWTCIDQDNARNINGVIVTPEIARKYLSPLYPGDTQENVCWEAVANRDCSFNVGQMDCWTDPQGVEHCPENDGSVPNTCAALEENPDCAFLRSECVDGATDPDSGICYAHTRVYDCGQDVETPTATREDGYVCDGGINCMGTSCVEHDPMMDTDFARAVGALQAAQFASQDLTCTESGQCEVFKGKPYYCKKAMGGWQDCCEQPAGTSLQDYMDLMMAANKAASAETWMGMSNPVYGSWTAIKEGVSAAGDFAWSKMTQPFTKAWEGIVGDTAEKLMSKAPTVLIQETLNKLTQKAAEWVMNTFGEAAVNALFSAGADAAAAGATTAAEALATEGATGAIVQLGGAVLGPIMWAYMIYQICNILVQIIWACEEEEFELGSKRQLKSCHYVGSYCASKAIGCVEKRDSFCCYESPLSRILNEQIKDQLDLPWGDPEEPQCGGIPLTALPNVDWSRINLDEWIGILTMTGHMPTVNSDKLSAAGLTGSGSYLNVNGTRVDYVERATSKIEGVSVPDVNEDLRQQLYGN